MKIHEWLALTMILSLAACGARSTPGDDRVTGEGMDGGGASDSSPFVPGEETRPCCENGPDVKPNHSRDISDGPECGVPLVVEYIIENCGTEPVGPPVLVQLLAGDPRGPNSRVLRETRTQAGMPPAMGQLVVFEVSAEEWAAAVEEFSDYARSYFVFTDAAGEVDECREANNYEWGEGPCP